MFMLRLFPAALQFALRHNGASNESLFLFVPRLFLTALSVWCCGADMSARQSCPHFLASDIFFFYSVFCLVSCLSMGGYSQLSLCFSSLEGHFADEFVKVFLFKLFILLPRDHVQHSMI